MWTLDGLDPRLKVRTPIGASLLERPLWRSVIVVASSYSLGSESFNGNLWPGRRAECAMLFQTLSENEKSIIYHKVLMVPPSRTGS